MEIERRRNTLQGSFSQLRNKENLLKMEIESWGLLAAISALWYQKQRKSPENGDWKKQFMQTFNFVVLCETKKISWKWRLKVFHPISALQIYPPWNKENLLKMEIERKNCLISPVTICTRKQRKSPENGDWKLLSSTATPCNPLEKQRKSPENGDWKLRLLISIGTIMRLETKKISWKWRLKADLAVWRSLHRCEKQRKSPENGDWKLLSI